MSHLATQNIELCSEEEQNTQIHKVRSSDLYTLNANMAIRQFFAWPSFQRN